MDYIWILLLTFAIQNNAQENTSETRRITNDDSFDVNIGAGYGVGPDQPSDALPRSTTKIIRTREYPTDNSQINLARTTREPRILTNFSPINITDMKSQTKPLNRIYDFTNFDSTPNNFGGSSLKAYQVHESQSDDSHHPNLIQLQKVINGLDKPNSKIVEVIKVPAVYEIHVQRDTGKGDQKNSVTENFDQPSSLKTYGSHKNIFNGFSTKFSDEYIQWLKDYYKKKEEEYLQERENFKHEHFSSLPNFDDTFDESPEEWKGDHLQENKVLEPVLAHHFKNVGIFENKRDKDEILHSTEPTSKLKYSPWQEGKDILYGTNSVKKDVGLGNYKTNQAFYKHGFSQVKRSPEFYKTSNKFGNFKSSEFRRNQEFTEFNQPQALHEVPAPYLGKYPKPKAFELDKSNDFMPQHSTSKLLSQERKPLDTPYNHIKGKPYAIKPEVVPTTEKFISSIKGTQNFIYGRQTEPVLSPTEINITTENSTTKRNFLNSEYHRSDYKENPNVNRIQNIFNIEEIPNEVVSSPDVNEASKNDSNAFNKKSDTIYTDYSKKDALFVDGIDSMDSWDISKPVNKNTFFSIYPKKVFDSKKNLFHTKDLKSGIMYNMKEMKPGPTKSQNQSKPVGYVIYITKKSREEK